MSAVFHLEVVTPEAQVLDEQVNEVSFPLSDGMIGILAHHAPLLGKVKPGPLTVKSAAGVQVYYVHGGFAQMVNNRLMLLVEEALPKSQISVDAARHQLEAALTLPGATREDFQRREEQMAQARAKLGMVE